MDCMQLALISAHSAILLCFNTASGMDCMQYDLRCERYRENKEFQYRKRYGLHAIVKSMYDTMAAENVSIPQAVWIACNSTTEVV